MANLLCCFFYTFLFLIQHNRHKIYTKGGRMNKKKLMIAQQARLAERDGVTVEHVRSQMKIAMLHGMCNPDPKIKAYWRSIPYEGDVPTPEELIIYITEQAIRRRKF